MNDIFSIKNKVAVITGATGVLGGSIANSFVAAGARVVVLGTKQDKVDNKVADLQAAGGQVIGFACNVLDVPALEKVCSEIVAQWGAIDILLNIAGGKIGRASCRERV